MIIKLMFAKLESTQEIANKDGHKRETLITQGKTGSPKSIWS